MSNIARAHLKFLMEREQKRFVEERPKSKALFERAGKSLLGGVPMNWMMKWAGAFPPFVREAQGALLRCGRSPLHRLLPRGYRRHDWALAIRDGQGGRGAAARGITFMLPTEDAVYVGEELQHRFGLPYWQFALTATDANRFSIRLARQITHRPKILVFNWCYHGTVDETFITLKDGVV